jgi:hypothetical protein
MVKEMDFWLKRMENVTVRFLTLTKEKDVPTILKEARETNSFFKVGGRVYQLTKYRVDVDGPRPESYMEDRQLAQHLPADQVSPSTWKTARWLSICLQTRSVPLPGRPPAGSASASRQGMSLYLEDHQMTQHLPPDQVCLSTWKTAS